MGATYTGSAARAARVFLRGCVAPCRALPSCGAAGLGGRPLLRWLRTSRRRREGRRPRGAARARRALLRRGGGHAAVRGMDAEEFGQLMSTSSSWRPTGTGSAERRRLRGRRRGGLVRWPVAHGDARRWRAGRLDILAGWTSWMRVGVAGWRRRGARRLGRRRTGVPTHPRSADPEHHIPARVVAEPGTL